MRHAEPLIRHAQSLPARWMRAWAFGAVLLGLCLGAGARPAVAQDAQSPGFVVKSQSALGGANRAVDARTVHPRYEAQSPSFTVRALFPGQAAATPLPASTNFRVAHGPLYRGRHKELFEAPRIASVVLKDTDASGGVDRAQVVFDEAIDEATLNLAAFALDGQAAASRSDAIGGDEHLWLDFSPELPGTGLRDFRYFTAPGGFLDFFGNALGDVGSADVAEIDGAPPVIVITAPGASTTIPAPRVVYTLSEPVNAASIAWNRQSGSPDAAAPHLAALSGADLGAGTHGPVSGNPTPALVESGVYGVQMTATDAANNSASASVAGLTFSTLAISTSTLAAAQVGSVYSATVAATGGYPALSWTLQSGMIPPGLTLNAANGQISGIPTTIGSYGFTIEVTDASPQGMSASRAYTVEVSPAPPAISSAPPPSGKVGQSYSHLYTATGGVPPYTWSASSLPPGMTLVTATGELKSLGSPALVAGNYPITVTATDSQSPAGSAQQGATLVIAPKDLSIITTSLAGAKVSTAYSVTLLGDGGAPSYSWSISSGALPAGLALQAVSGKISGLPSGPAGSFTFTVRLVDSASPSPAAAQRAFTLAVAPSDLAWQTVTWNDAIESAAYTQSLAASGGTPPYAFSRVSGSLPSGLSLSASGVISGTPSAGSTGSYSVTMRVTDAGTPTPQAVERAFGLTVQPAGLTLTTTSLPGAQQDVAYSATLQAGGGVAPRGFSIASGALPAGLTLETTTGAITGSPTAIGSFSFTARVTDAAANSADKALTIVVMLPQPNLILELSTELGATTLDWAQAGVSFSQSGAVAAQSTQAHRRFYFLNPGQSGQTVTISYPGLLSVTSGALNYASQTATVTVQPRYPIALAITDELGQSIPSAGYGFSQSGVLTPTVKSGNVRYFAFSGAAGQTVTVSSSGYITTASAPLNFGPAPAVATIALPYSLRVIGANQGFGQPVSLENAVFTGFGFSVVKAAFAGGISYLAATPGNGTLSVEAPGFELATRAVPVSATASVTVDFDDGVPGDFAAALDGPKLVPTNFNLTISLRDELGAVLDARSASFTFSGQGLRTPDRVAGGTASFTLDVLQSPQSCAVSLPGFVTAATASLAYSPNPVAAAVALAYSVKVVSARNESGLIVPLDGQPFSSTGFVVQRQIVHEGVGYLAAEGGFVGNLLVAQSGYVVQRLGLTPTTSAESFVSFGTVGDTQRQALIASGALDPATEAVTEGPALLYAVRLRIEDELGNALPAEQAAFRFGVTGVLTPDALVGAEAFFAMTSGNSGETCTITMPGFQPMTTGALSYLTAQASQSAAMRYQVEVSGAQDRFGTAIAIDEDALSVSALTLYRAARNPATGSVCLAVSAGSGALELSVPGYLRASAPLTVPPFARVTVAFDGASDPSATTHGPALDPNVLLTVSDAFGGAVSGAAFTLSSDGAQTPVNVTGTQIALAVSGASGQIVTVTAPGLTNAAGSALSFSALSRAEQTLVLDFPLVVLGATTNSENALDLAQVTISAQGIAQHGVRRSADGTQIGVLLDAGSGQIGANHASAGSAAVGVSVDHVRRRTVDFDLGTPGRYAAEIDGPALSPGGADLFKVTLRVVDDFGAPLDPSTIEYFFTGHQEKRAPAFATTTTGSFSLDTAQSGEDVVLTRSGFIETRLGPLHYAETPVDATVTLPYSVVLAFTDEHGAPLDCANFRYQHPGLSTDAADGAAGHQAGFALPPGTSGRFSITAPGFLSAESEILTAAADQQTSATVVLRHTVKVLGATTVMGEVVSLGAARVTGTGVQVTAVTPAPDGSLGVAVTAGSGSIKIVVDHAGVRWFCRYPLNIAGDQVLVLDLDAESSDLAPGSPSPTDFGAPTDGPPLITLIAELRDTNLDGKLDSVQVEFADPVSSAQIVPSEFSLGGKPASGLLVDGPDRVTLRFFKPQVSGTQRRDLLYAGASVRYQDGSAHPALDAAAVLEIDRAAPVVLLVTGLDTDGNEHPERVVIQASEPLSDTNLDLAHWSFTDGDGVQLDMNGARATLSGDAVVVTLSNTSGAAGALGYRYAPDPPENALTDLAVTPNRLQAGDTTPPAAPIARLPDTIITEVGVATSLDGRSCYDPNGGGDVVSWVWSEENGNPAAGLLSRHGSQDAPAASVSARRAVFVPPSTGEYRFRITITDRSSLSATAVTRVIAQSAEVIVPLARAVVRPAQILLGGEGPRQFACVGHFSRDPDHVGGALAYDWAITRKPERSAVDLTPQQREASTFTLVPDEPGLYVLQLRVTDGEDDGLTSAPDEVSVRVVDARDGRTPLLAARPEYFLEWEDDGDFMLESGELAYLNGVDAPNPSGGTLQYRWRQLSGPEPLWRGVRTDARLPFRARGAGWYEVELQLTTAAGHQSFRRRVFPIFEARVSSALSRQAALSEPGRPAPTVLARTVTGAESATPFTVNAVVSAPQVSADSGATPVTLSAQTSESGLSYWWEQIDGPAARIVDRTAAQTEMFVFDSGVHRFRLNAENAAGERVSSDVSVTAMVNGRNLPPLAVLSVVSAQETVKPGTPVTFSGADSTDPAEDPDGLLAPEGYWWRQIAGPDLSLAMPTGPTLSFVPALAGTYTFELRVDDGQQISEAATRSIVVEAPPQQIVNDALQTVAVPAASGGGGSGACGAPVDGAADGLRAIWPLLAMLAALGALSTRSRREC